eukprot:SAG11_NODE_114_length_16040_cov_10.050875_15_plen_194_part_00
MIPRCILCAMMHCPRMLHRRMRFLGVCDAYVCHRSGGAKLWLLDETAWERLSSEILAQHCGGLSRLLPVLGTVPPLALLSPFQLLGLCFKLEWHRFGPETRLFSAGAVDDGRGLYIVQQGAVALSAEWEVGRQPAESFAQSIELKGAGHACGVEGLLPRCPRTTTALAAPATNGAVALQLSAAVSPHIRCLPR